MTPDTCPAGTPRTEVLAAAVESAVRAPSGHNTQPWRFRLAGDRVEVHADRSRALPVVDPEDRALVISCGAAVTFLVVALRHAGYDADVDLRRDPNENDLLARVDLGRPRTPTDLDHRLFAAIEGRRTHRAAFESRPVPADIIDHLRVDADRLGARLDVVVEDRVKGQVADLVARGDRVQMANTQFRQELAAWMRSSYTWRGDGIPGHALGIPGPASLLAPVLMRTIDMGARQAARDAELALTSPALLLLSTPGDTQADWLAAGQALGLLLLTATSFGLAASFLNQPIETPELRPLLGELLDPAIGQPQLLLRLGHPRTPARPTPRRPVGDVLIPR